MGILNVIFYVIMRYLTSKCPGSEGGDHHGYPGGARGGRTFYRGGGTTARGRGRGVGGAAGVGRGRGEQEQGNAMPSVEHSNIQCYKCHGFGHIAADCPSIQAGNRGRGQAPGANPGPQGAAAPQDGGAGQAQAPQPPAQQ